MCGIFGTVNYHLEQEQIIKCLDLIKHRGPDGYGVYQKENIILGHRRLSILDVSENGKQPMSYYNGRFVITYNGEIYNFLEIRSELRKKGYSFQTETDTEVILAAYMEWREKCLLRFNGMWAFAIWDKKENELFLSRDRFGIKPLYYSLDEGNKSFMFASEMKALIPILPKVSVDYDLIERSGIFGYEATAECLIKEIERLPAGHCATLKNNKLLIKRWWNTLDHMPVIPERYEEQVELFRDLFIDACKIRMRSDVTIGTALSGGLDSSATICTMAHIANRGYGERVNHDWQHAFIAAFPGTTLDESYFANRVTQSLGIESTIIDINKICSPDALEADLYMFEEIYLTSPLPMMATYQKVKENGVTVTIDGHGADELFCGYSSDFFAGFPDARFNKKRIDEILKIYWDTYPHDASNLAVTGKEKDYCKYLKYMAEYMSKGIRHKLNIQKCIDANQPNWKKLDYVGKLMYVRTHTDILPTLLRNYDRYSMAGSVEIRMPFLDYRIVTLASALPNTAKLRNGFSKAIIRDALREYMPEEVVNRKTKIGFNTPIVEWMQGELREYLSDMVSSSDFLSSNFVNAVQVRNRIMKVINGENNVKFSEAEDAYKSLAPYLWERCFYKKIISER